MRTAQVLKNKNDLNMDDVGMKELASTVLLVKSAISKAKPAELLPKETDCCNIATD